MRKFRKIALMLIILALSVSCLAVATAATRAVTVANATDLMEYYDGVVISEDFESLTVGDAYTGSALDVPAGHSEQLTVAEDSGEKALYLYATPTNAIDTYFVANLKSDAKGFGFDFSIKLNTEGATHSRQSRGKFVVLADVYTKPESNNSQEIFAMAPKLGYLTVATSSGTMGIPDVPILNDVRYDVSYYCSFETGKFAFTVKWNDGTGEQSYTSEEFNSGFTSLTTVKFGFRKQALAATKNYLYSLRAYNGSFQQGVMAEDVAATVDAYVQQLVNTYENNATSADDKFKISCVFADLKSIYSYSAKDAALEAKVAAIADIANVTYAETLINGAGLIDITKPYAARVLHVESIRKYYNHFATIDSVDGVDTAQFTAAKSAYAAELADLADVKADSEAVVAAVGSLTLDSVENSNYEALKPVYDNVKGLDSVDVTYSTDTAAASIIANVLVAKVEAIEDKAEKFIDAVEVIGTQGTKVGPLYAAYTAAEANKDADGTYPGVAAAKSVYDAYDATALLAQVAVCDKIIVAVNKAEMSNNYVSRKALTDSVAADVASVDVEALDYPGLADAVEGYAELVAALAVQTNAADKYLEAVAAIKDCDTFEEIKAAVAAALALKDTGAIEGVAGVKEANLLLAAKESYVNCLEGYSKTFIALVNELKEASDIHTRLELINEAESIKASGHDGYAGFSAAVTEFEAQKTAYNDDVKAANSAFASLVGNAVDSVSSTAPSLLSKAAGVVKKILE